MGHFDRPANGAHQLPKLSLVTARARPPRRRCRSPTVNNGGGGGTALTINGNQRFQTIDGFGVSANVASWNYGELRPALDRLLAENNSTIWRVIIEMADWEESQR